MKCELTRRGLVGATPGGDRVGGRRLRGRDRGRHRHRRVPPVGGARFGPTRRRGRQHHSDDANVGTGSTDVVRASVGTRDRRGDRVVTTCRFERTRREPDVSDTGATAR